MAVAEAGDKHPMAVEAPGVWEGRKDTAAG